MKYGVKNVVITDTDTIIGYSVLLVAPSDVPSGDDKRELSNLHQRESRLDGNAQRLSGDKHASCAEHNHADNHYCREDEDWHGVGGQHLWVDHHAYRHEEDCSEQILYRGHYS